MITNNTPDRELNPSTSAEDFDDIIPNEELGELFEEMIPEMMSELFDK